MFKYVVLLALVPAILATSGVSRCRSGVEMPSYINIDNCEVAPCRIPLGSTARMLLGFNTRKLRREGYANQPPILILMYAAPRS